MLISELFDAICWEISVESGSTDFQLVDDITDEWIIFCVFEHRFSMLDGLFVNERSKVTRLQRLKVTHP